MHNSPDTYSIKTKKERREKTWKERKKEKKRRTFLSSGWWLLREHSWLPHIGTTAHSWQSSHHAFLGRNREPPPSLTKDGFARASSEEDALLHFIRGRPAWNAALRPWRGRNKHENTCQVGIGRFLFIRGSLVSLK